MIINENKPNFRQVGKEINGKLVKGIAIDPLNKTTSSSIPHKYETILYRNNNPRGFSASSQRFYSFDDSIPGPGAYKLNANLKQEYIPSISKKGLGNGFASGTQRVIFKNFLNTGPGPGSYDFKDKSFEITNYGHNTSFSSSTPKHRPKSHNDNNPGPGDYDPKRWETEGSKNIASVFRSQSRRSEFRTFSCGAPIGNYNIDRSIITKKPFKHIGVSSSFMNPIPQTKTAERDKINELLGKEKPNNGKNIPGPGSYFYPIQDETLLLKQSLMMKPNSMFMEGNTTRFGIPMIQRTKKVILPGPGAYTKEYNTPERTLVSGSVFMSESIRKPYGNIKRGVGPTSYNPGLLPKKKSFHLRLGNEWLQYQK